MDLVCLVCAGNRIVAEIKIAKGEDVELPVVNDAWTMSPTWQQQIVGGTQLMACVAVPVCREHLSVAEVSPAEQALRNGQLLRGRVG